MPTFQFLNIVFIYFCTTLPHHWFVILILYRLQTLLSVDDGIDKVIETLKLKQMIDETYIFFTSDNGFHLGKVVSCTVLYLLAIQMVSMFVY